MIISAKSKQYRVISKHYIKVGIWDNCYEGIAVRGDGLRARIKLPYVRWQNNSGSLDTDIIYYDGREAVKKLMRDLRKLQIADIKGQLCSNLYEIIAGRC